ncbi:hypothetical protein [Thermonema rossianum]|uniref:hypothetical protein n=1 Tax=Thermonema rossianum TaxID=55505 RepID=UPI00056FAA58|nr:hypothetical protein [Thermonema rossianum]
MSPKKRKVSPLVIAGMQRLLLVAWLVAAVSYLTSESSGIPWPWQQRHYLRIVDCENNRKEIVHRIGPKVWRLSKCGILIANPLSADSTIWRLCYLSWKQPHSSYKIIGDVLLNTDIKSKDHKLLDYYSPLSIEELDRELFFWCSDIRFPDTMGQVPRWKASPPPSWNGDFIVLVKMEDGHCLFSVKEKRFFTQIDTLPSVYINRFFREPGREGESRKPLRYVLVSWRDEGAGIFDLKQERWVVKKQAGEEQKKLWPIDDCVYMTEQQDSVLIVKEVLLDKLLLRVPHGECIDIKGDTLVLKTGQKTYELYSLKKEEAVSRIIADSVSVDKMFLFTWNQGQRWVRIFTHPQDALPVEPSWDISLLTEDLLRINQNGYLKLYSFNQKRYWPAKFDSVEVLNEGVIVSINGKKGVYSLQGEEIVPVEFLSIRWNEFHWMAISEDGEGFFYARKR